MIETLCLYSKFYLTLNRVYIIRKLVSLLYYTTVSLGFPASEASIFLISS